MSKDIILSTNNLTKQFGELKAVDQVTWNVPQGQTKAVIGPNGAGKSTLFNLLSGVLVPSEGSIDFDGESLVGAKEHEIAQRGMIKTYQTTNIFQESTVFENIRLAAQSEETTFNMWSKASELSSVNNRAEAVLNRTGLRDNRDRIAGDLPHGLQRKVEIGIALATEPDILLLDEPIAGMSEEGRQKMIQLLQDLSEDSSLTLVITEHDIDLITNVAETITVLHQGKVLIDGKPSKIIGDEQVQNIYLGSE